MDVLNPKYQLTLIEKKDTNLSQDKFFLSQVPDSFSNLTGVPTLMDEELVEGSDFSLRNGDIVMAGIICCPNTPNPADMVEAGLLAQKAVALGLKVKPWVNAFLALDAQRTTDLLAVTGLQESFHKLGFELVVGDTICTGNTEPLLPGIEPAIERGDLTVASVLSDHQKLEQGRQQTVKANYLTLPLLVVAYAIAGTVKKNLMIQSLAYDKYGKPVYLKDLWPTAQEIQAVLKKYS